MSTDLILAVAVILLATRLPSAMRRLGMSKSDKVALIFLMFFILVAAWLIWRTVGMLL